MYLKQIYNSLIKEMILLKILKNKQGIGLPMVLGIIVFVIGITASMMSYIVFQSKIVEIDIKQTEDYQNSVSDVSAALEIISRDQNLERNFLDELEIYFNVTITNYNDSFYTITSMIDDKDQVISYITGSTAESDMYDTLFQHTGTENDFNLSPLVTPTNMLTTFIPGYIGNSFSWITPQTGFTSFNQVMNYIKDLSRQGSTFQYKQPRDLEDQWQPEAWWYWYVDGDVEIENGKKNTNNFVRNLRVQDGQILFINGDLTMHEGSTIYGNVVVNGDLEIKGQGSSEQGIEGTIYVNGDVKIDKRLRLGTPERPSFIFANGDIELDKHVSGVGYFLCDEFEGDHNTIRITGGVYANDDDSDLPKKGITPNTEFNNNKLYSYAIPNQITTESGTPGEPGQSGTSFKFTFPKLK